MKRFSVISLLVLAPCFVAKANITPASLTITGTGPYTWAYDLHLSSDQNVSAGFAAAVNPVSHTNFNYGSFFTLYDFAGYVNGSCAGPAGWVCRVQLVGFTPDDVTPIDNPGLVNITWSRTSGGTITGPADLGVFSAQSSFNLASAVSFTARAVANSGPGAGAISDNVGQSQAPTDAPLLPTCTSPTVISGAGPTGAPNALANFEAAIGGVNNGGAPPANFGFRTINWDGVTLNGTDFGGNTTVIVPNKITGIPQNRFQSRGVMLDRVHAVANDGFLSVNPGTQFTAFSASNTFASYNDNVVTVNFVLPSSPPAAASPALTRGFGAIFLDVEEANTSSIEYFNGSSSLGKFFAPMGTSGQAEFLGVLFGSPVVTSARITLGTALLFIFDGTTFVSGSADAPPTVDQVALDDFAYAEPSSTSFTINAIRSTPFSGTLTSFKDSGGSDIASAFTAMINWGDGTTSSGTVSGSAACFNVGGTHTYNTTGIFLLTITINDFGGAFGVVNGTARVTASAVDFNADAKSDIVLQDTASDVAVWLMNGSTVNAGAIAGSPGAAWRVVATGDFGGDGRADVVLQNSSTGDVAEWQMNGTAISAGAMVGSPGAAWKVVAAGDVDGDGRSDLILQNSSTGDVAVWEMSGLAISSGGLIGTPGMAWNVIAAGDLNGDGQADVLLQNSSTGDIAGWMMHGTTIFSAALIGSPGTQWKLIGTGDFNADGRSDLLLQNTVTSDVVEWQMNGFAISSGLVATPGVMWTALGTSDYNGDGFADILLRDSSGNIAQWQMHSFAISGAAIVSNPGAAWTPVVK